MNNPVEPPKENLEDTPLIEIRSRYTNAVLFAQHALDMRAAVIAACSSGANLDGANLYRANLYRANLDGANLDGANLDGANLDGANLVGANLDGANLYRANLVGANLVGANLVGANLVGANLDGANLVGANLVGANLVGANLDGAKINWSSHAIISQILLQAAGEDIGRRKIAGLILVSPDWCWGKWISLRKSRHFAWAIDTLAAFVQPGDDAPSILADRAAELRALASTDVSKAIESPEVDGA